MSRAKIEARKNAKKSKKGQGASRIKKQPIWLLVALVLTLIAYANIYDNQYINYDDDVYVTENVPLVNLDISTLFSETYLNQYSPLAMTIMGIELKAAGDSVAMVRAGSVLIHLLCVVMVFFLFRLLFKDDMMAGFLALLFGVSPMQVESVAWLAASFKVGTYALFFLAALWAYVKYKDSHDKKYLFFCYVAFLASCLCKEQAVVLPVVLILIDYLKGSSLFSPKVWISKAPMFVISVIFGVLTLTASQGGELVQKVHQFGLFERMLFALSAVGTYAVKSFIPYDLSFFYTYPMQNAVPVEIYLTAVLAIGLIALAIWAFKKEKKMLFFGIAFFLLNVALTSLTAVLSVRDVMMADRYNYLPIIGLFGASIYYVWNKREAWSPNLRYVFLLFALGFIMQSFSRVDDFQDSVSLFTDVIEKESYPDKRNPYLALAYNNRGIEFKRAKQFDRAQSDYEAAIASNSSYASAYLNRGNIYFDGGNDELAKLDYDKVLELEKNAKAYSARGAIFAKQKMYDEALADLNSAIEMDKYFIDAYSNRVLTYLDMGRFEDGIADCNTILSFVPNRADMLELRGYLKAQSGKHSQAIEDFSLSLKVNPKSGATYFNRAASYAAIGNKTSAKQDAVRAKELGYPVPDSFMNQVR